MIFHDTCRCIACNSAPTQFTEKPVKIVACDAGTTPSHSYLKKTWGASQSCRELVAAGHGEVTGSRARKRSRERRGGGAKIRVARTTTAGKVRSHGPRSRTRTSGASQSRRELVAARHGEATGSRARAQNRERRGGAKTRVARAMMAGKARSHGPRSRTHTSQQSCGDRTQPCGLLWTSSPGATPTRSSGG